MPNTLSHLGVQVLVTRSILRDADVKWIWAACVVPDLPWIGQRVARSLAPDLSAIDIRLYAIVQSTLLCCLVLSAALACFSQRPGRTFGILAGGVFLHLILDALQTKWANGVVLIAPLRWDLLNFGLFWPDDAPSLGLGAIGLLVALYAWLRLPMTGDDLRRPPVPMLAAALAFLALYLAGPLALMPQAAAADLHYAATLRETEARDGRPIGFDRNQVGIEGGEVRLTAWTGEVFQLTGKLPPESGTVSIRGRFRDAKTIEVSALHRHPTRLRDHASYLGLGLVAVWWIRCLLGRLRPAAR